MELLQRRESSEEVKNIVSSLLIQFIWIMQNSTVDTQASRLFIEKLMWRLRSCWIPVLVCTCIHYKTLHILIWYIGNKTLNKFQLGMCYEAGVIQPQLFKVIQDIVWLFCWLSLDLWRPDSFLHVHVYHLACIRTLWWLNPISKQLLYENLFHVNCSLSSLLIVLIVPCLLCSLFIVHCLFVHCLHCSLLIVQCSLFLLFIVFLLTVFIVHCVRCWSMFLVWCSSSSLFIILIAHCLHCQL